MTEKTTTTLPRGMRRLVIRGETWGWRFGKTIPIVHPDGSRTKVDLRALTDMDWHSLERAAYKRYLTVSPGDVVSHINRKMLGYTDAAGFPKGVVPEEWRQTLRNGWIGVEGPRGLWQYEPSPWIVKVVSPEDVVTKVRVYEILDMPLDEWADLKKAAIVASGSTVDDEITKARGRDMESAVCGFLGWDGPGMPKPTDRQFLAFVERLVARA